MKLAIELSPAQEERLAAVAGRLGIPVSELAEAAIRDLVARSGSDFDEVAKRVLGKNQELYERLA